MAHVVALIHCGYSEDVYILQPVIGGAEPVQIVHTAVAVRKRGNGAALHEVRREVGLFDTVQLERSSSISHSVMWYVTFGRVGIITVSNHQSDTTVSSQHYLCRWYHTF